jgi:hypothetical protein
VRDPFNITIRHTIAVVSSRPYGEPNRLASGPVMPMNDSAPLSASRNARLASAFVACFALIVFAAWRSLGKSVPPHRDVMFLLFEAYSIFVCLGLFPAFKGIRERLIFGITTLGLAKGLFAGLMPHWIEPQYGLL